MRDDITIIMTIWFPNDWRGDRKHKHAIDTLTSWHHHLIYDGDLFLIIQDDGSTPARFTSFINEMSEILARDGSITGWQADSCDGERLGVGASLNRGFKYQGDVFLYMVDDWAIDPNVMLDITPWVDLLRNEPDVCMVRLGPPHPNTHGDIVMYPQGWALKLDRYAFAFGHRPALYHRRMIDTYGPFDEGESALECERMYNERFARMVGPDIILALPTPFFHTSDDVHVSEEKPGVDDDKVMPLPIDL